MVWFICALSIDVSDPANPKVYSFGPNQRDDRGEGDDVASWK
jgi:hypothetical protein